MTMPLQFLNPFEIVHMQLLIVWLLFLELAVEVLIER